MGVTSPDEEGKKMGVQNGQKIHAKKKNNRKKSFYNKHVSYNPIQFPYWIISGKHRLTHLGINLPLPFDRDETPLWAKKKVFFPSNPNEFLIVDILSTIA